MPLSAGAWFGHCEVMLSECPPTVRTDPIVTVSSTNVAEILALRERHRKEMNCQLVYDSFPERGFSDPYLILVDDRVAGHGLVANWASAATWSRS